MFLSFFYFLRKSDIDVSMDEWLTLMAALKKGLAHSSLTGFYQLCRAILVKSEADFDRFDQLFYEYFKDVHTPEDLPEEFWSWLEDGLKPLGREDGFFADMVMKELPELLETFRKRLEEQKEKHDGGNYWIGTGGTSTQGHSGYHISGIRTGDMGRFRSALQVAGERNFKDFREDQVIDIRQFQVAFRKLRQYSSRVDTRLTELDIEGTVKETSDQAGLLHLVYEKPRKNTVKILLLMDSDGSMMPYSKLCNRLFQAVSQANHFKDLKVYYFHNCIYEHLYRTPLCKRSDWVDTDWVLSNLGEDYKVVLVGDATMARSELFMKGGNCILGMFNEELGIEWLKKFKRRYKNSIWLNPISAREWPKVYGNETIREISKVFPMFELTLDGLDKGIKKLLTK